MVYTYVHHCLHIFLIIFITHYYNVNSVYVSLICNIYLFYNLVFTYSSSEEEGELSSPSAATPPPASGASATGTATGRS